ncbi:MAG: amphi-Trp domain-containing protein [Desulfovibrio sp.]|nr:amphi-Trp domain-containing protein [Desulfovibrio sp.]
MSKSGLAIKGAMDFDSVSTFLTDLVASFKERTICVQRGEEFVTLKPGELIELELEVLVKKGKQKLSLELAWRDEVLTEVEAPFKVSAKEPELPAPVVDAGDAAGEAAGEVAAPAVAAAAPAPVPRCW